MGEVETGSTARFRPSRPSNAANVGPSKTIGIRLSFNDFLRGARRVARGVLVGSFALVVTDAISHPLSLQECFEGGDFIAHAAQARDSGMTKAAFNDKLLADMYLIQAFPKELRWFVQDPDDAEFLLAESTLVFDRPREPEAHRTDFLSRCFDRKLGVGPSDPTESREDLGLPPGKPESRERR